MEERRKLERFEMNAPARVFIEPGGGRKSELNLSTRDVSSAGAFLYSAQDIPEGANVKMEFLIALDTLGQFAGGTGRAKVRVKGKVVRLDPEGVAVRFDSSYKITALDNNSKNSLP
jgi:hypothetical protein